jgi:hypothetical protein
MADARTLDIQENPSWVLELPDADNIEPPVDTLEQELPFGKLKWQNFERLCLRLAATDGDAEYYRLYGTDGQEQGGIDIYVRRRSTAKYATWQSKRRKSFSPGHIEKAVNEFIDGEWLVKSDRFVLCVQASLRSTSNANEIERQAARLAEQGVEFLPLDGEQLSERLKSFPQIVHDFFGITWVKRFCGDEAAQSVERRLRPTEFRQLKTALTACYESHFSSVDPGVLSLTTASLGAKRQLPLFQRFVVPDLMQQIDILADEPSGSSVQAAPLYDPASGLEEALPLVPRMKDRERARILLDNWIAAANH